MMADTHLTIRRQDDDPFEQLAAEFGTGVSEGVRAACNAVLRSPELLEQVRAELAVTAFVWRLQRKYSRLASLRFNIPAQGSADDFNFAIAQRGKSQTEPINWSELDPRLTEVDAGWTLDLVDPGTGYGLMGAWHWESREPATADVLFRALHVPRPLTGPPTVEVDHEGQRAIESRDTEGNLHRYVLGADGKVRHLPIRQHVARAYEVVK
jgi:hypothetical protein